MRAGANSEQAARIARRGGDEQDKRTRGAHSRRGGNTPDDAIVNAHLPKLDNGGRKTTGHLYERENTQPASHREREHTTRLSYKGRRYLRLRLRRSPFSDCPRSRGHAVPPGPSVVCDGIGLSASAGRLRPATARRRRPPVGLHGRPAPLAALHVLLGRGPLALDRAPTAVTLGVARCEARLAKDVVAEVARLAAALLGLVGRARVRAPVIRLRADVDLISGRLLLARALLG